jgi:hypothetical protein
VVVAVVGVPGTVAPILVSPTLVEVAALMARQEKIMAVMAVAVAVVVVVLMVVMAVRVAAITAMVVRAVVVEQV